MSMNESRRFFRWKGLLALALTAALLWAPALAQERVSFTTGLVGDGGDHRKTAEAARRIRKTLEELS